MINLLEYLKHIPCLRCNKLPINDILMIKCQCYNINIINCGDTFVYEYYLKIKSILYRFYLVERIMIDSVNLQTIKIGLTAPDGEEIISIKLENFKKYILDKRIVNYIINVINLR